MRLFALYKDTCQVLIILSVHVHFNNIVNYSMVASSHLHLEIIVNLPIWYL